METTENYLASVKKDSLAIEKVPDELKTAGLCLAAAKQDGFALEYVPDKLKTEIRQDRD